MSESDILDGYYNQWSKMIFEQNKAIGWWDDMDRCVFTVLQLISSEISEATEAERKDLMDDHLPHRKGGEVELADALIRTLDLGGRYGCQYYSAIPPLTTEVPNIFKLHFVCGKALHLVGQGFEDSLSDICDVNYSRLINTILATGHFMGYDVAGAMVEKNEYNKTRADHKREARAAAGGKKV
jgi:hypothetical protein